MEIRPAQPDDFSRIVQLWQERLLILSQADRRFDIIFQHDQAQVLAHLEGRIMDQQNSALLVAEEAHGDIAGYISGEMRTRFAIIDDMALDAHTYHAGLGRQLVRAMCNRFSPYSPEAFLIRTPRYYAVEQAFWRALGASEWKEIDWKTAPEYIWMRL